ncbi:AP1B1 [Bugula neritina]|uniref:AP1B1 n=1 Tax=Bugula neritina TaxID=10212 RepID=A0A7J7J7I1_BUGNE|nr:AP1B1 [Bugula neritina]
MHVLCGRRGDGKAGFLATWKDIPAQNEVQTTIANVDHSGDTVAQKLTNNNVFTIAKRNVEGQDMLYQSMRLTNGIWCLAELKIQPGSNAVTVSILAMSQL